MRPTQLLATLVTVSTLTAAWPWPPNFAKVREVVGVERGLDGLENLIYGRADNSSTAASSASAKATGTSDNSAASKTSAATTADSTDSAATTGTNTDSSATGKTTGKTTGTAKATSDDSNTGSANSTSYDARLGAGGISMLTPAATATSSYYKIGDWVSFAWNYTSLSATPSAVNVIASCSLNDATYTIAENMSVHQTGMVYWDTSKDKNDLVQETYTLVVYNAAHAVTQTAGAGYFGAASAFTFAMYAPQTYTPRSEWTCVACESSGITSAEKQTLGFLFAMVGVTIASFTWFVVGFGVV
ncbi:hypothetical protein K490DRAFT_47812 [Saccharata proteae CBS 121410]|uniref:DUF7137 domain-containing protein n=1 Tax=Saccharata proteae CBS 121410 TaxID=1314787 RepID=A0A9P4LWC8_9PEZI|nr:hypothetical protein K490DRAFT_47812 [Saccharata proteae CBS 121410]